MRRILLIIGAMLLLGGCSTAKKTEQRRRLERCDTLRAILAEELTVKLDDVRIIPPDTLRPRIKVESIVLERQRAAQVQAVETEQVEAVRVETPVTPPAARLNWLPWALLFALIAIIFYLRAS